MGWLLRPKKIKKQYNTKTKKKQLIKEDFMKVYSTSYFKVYHKDFEGNWDYLISETPLNFGAIEGLLQLNYKERIQILEIIERSKGIIAINLGDKTYGFEYCFETKIEGQHPYRLLNAKFEDISVSDIEIRQNEQEKKREERKRKFQENMKKADKWVEHKKKEDDKNEED